MINEFDNEIKYKLFRTVKEILHPTISKKNISDYKVILKDEILPIRVFYPKKVTNMEKVMIFIHGNGKVTDCTGKYSTICKNLSLKTDSLMIAVEYRDLKQEHKKMYEDIFKTIKYLYKELEENNIDSEKIALMGDSTGCNIITGINYLNKKKINIKKEILFYPTLSLEYFGKTKYESIQKNNDFNFELLGNLQTYYTYIATKKDLKGDLLNPLRQNQEITPPTLLFTGTVDSLIDEAKEYYQKLDLNKSRLVELPFSSHGFLKKMDKEIEEEIIEEINNFL